MSFSVVQSGANASGTTVNFSQATAAGNLLIVFDITNGAGNTCTSGANSLTNAAYSSGFGGAFAAVFYLANCPSGLTSATVSGTGPFAIGYMEVSGAAASPTVTAGTGGSNSAPSWTLANPAADATQFTVFSFTYNANNSGTAFSDGFTDTACSNFGQFSWTTTAGGSSATMSSSAAWAGAAASFTAAAGGASVALTTDALTLAAPVPSVGLGPNPLGPGTLTLAAPVPSLTFGAASIPLSVAQVTLAAPLLAPPAFGGDDDPPWHIRRRRQ